MKESSYLQGRVDLIEKFKGIPFLKAFKEEHVRAILSSSKMRKYDADEEIITEGAEDRHIFIIVAGAVRVIKNEKEVARLDKAGDIFGEMALLDSETRSATVKACTDTVCLAFDASNLDQMKVEDVTEFYVIFYRMLAEVLANRLRYATRELAKSKEKFELMELFVERKWY